MSLKDTINKFFPYIAPILIILTGIFIFYTSNPVVIIGDNKINIEIVSKPEDMAKGLSNRDNLDKNNGMLFVMNMPIITSFWMKEMRFPIDIIWINENLEIIKIDESIQPESYPNMFLPPAPVKYVLEINAGQSKERKIKIGDKVIIKN